MDCRQSTPGVHGAYGLSSGGGLEDTAVSKDRKGGAARPASSPRPRPTRLTSPRRCRSASRGQVVAKFPSQHWLTETAAGLEPHKMPGLLARVKR
jgi:hypothetical protein